MYLSYHMKIRLHRGLQGGESGRRHLALVGGRAAKCPGCPYELARAQLGAFLGNQSNPQAHAPICFRLFPDSRVRPLCAFAAMDSLGGGRKIRPNQTKSNLLKPVPNFLKDAFSRLCTALWRQISHFDSSPFYASAAAAAGL